jgi:hypothetical protein
MGLICICSIRIPWTAPVNVHSLFLAKVSIFKSISIILNVNIDSDDLKNELNSVPKTQQMVSCPRIILE